MSNLTDHIRTLRAVSKAFCDRAADESIDLDGPARLIIVEMGIAFDVAATELLNEVTTASAALAQGHRCSIDHRAMTVPKCPACGASKG